MRNKRSIGEKFFDTTNVVIMIILMIVTIYPFYYVIVASFSNNFKLTSTGMLLYPLGFTSGAYELALTHPLLPNAYKNTLIILAVSLPINIILTVLCSYFMAAKNMMFKKIIVSFMLFTMFFSGGLVPTYLLIRNTLHLYNTLWALILPDALILYYCIITKTAIESIPISLSESAYIDGANDFIVLFKIIIPLITPTLAVIALYYGVGWWNSWFPATIYLSDNSKLPLQAVLRAILISNSDLFQADGSVRVTRDGSIDDYSETIKYAAIVLSTVPILLVYPFIQKYFVKGVMVGAIKG